MHPWYASRFTGLFRECSAVPARAHDPQVALWSGEFATWGPRPHGQLAGGAGWDRVAAEAACVGEAIERLDPAPLADDQALEASWQDWPGAEPAVAPQRWVLFHPDQHAQPGFPFERFTPATVCRWMAFRQAGTGEPWWVPEELAFLEPPSGSHRLCPGVSTGLSCGKIPDGVLLRGLQEVIERDALVGAWWDRYRLEEWPLDEVLAQLEPARRARLLRPNLRYRCYQIDSPFSGHVAMVSLEGEDREGYCFSIGSACRESRAASWSKAILEAVQGRHYVRALKPTYAKQLGAVPGDFAEHAVWYSLHPDQLAQTILHQAKPPSARAPSRAEGLGELVVRLGPDRPVLFRNLTPPGIARTLGDWLVLRVLVPGLQPLHGDDRFPHLGGPLWAPRGLGEWSALPPHPFP